MRTLFVNLLDYFYPPQCALCRINLTRETHPPADAATTANSIAARILCPACNDFSTHPAETNTDRHCTRCNEPLPSSHLSTRCLLCDLHPLAPYRLWSAFPYDGTLEQLVKLYKYGRRRNLASALAQLMCYALPARSSAKNTGTIITAVPSTSAQLRDRGFFHLVPFAREVSRRMNFPYHRFALRSAGKRLPQAALDSEMRWKNISGAFRASPKVRGRQIILIDDVVTTGATIHTAAATLLDAGANGVIAITLARSRQFVHHRMKTAVQVA